jgi:hypothetical protein
MVVVIVMIVMITKPPPRIRAFADGIEVMFSELLMALTIIHSVLVLKDKLFT